MPNSDPAISKLIKEQQHHWLILNILSHLSIEDIAAVSQVSKFFNNNEDLWELLAKRVGDQVDPSLRKKYLSSAASYKAMIKAMKKEQREMMSKINAAGEKCFAKLPQDMQLEIFSFLNAKELVPVLQLNTFFANNDSFWKLFLKKKGMKYLQHHSQLTARQFFTEYNTRKKTVALELQDHFKGVYKPYDFLYEASDRYFELSGLSYLFNVIQDNLFDLCRNEKWAALVAYLDKYSEKIQRALYQWNSKEIKELLINALNNKDPQIFKTIAIYLSEKKILRHHIKRVIEHELKMPVFLITKLAEALHSKLTVLEGENEIPLIVYAILRRDRSLISLLIAWDLDCISYNYYDNKLRKTVTVLDHLMCPVEEVLRKNNVTSTDVINATRLPDYFYSAVAFHSAIAFDMINRFEPFFGKKSLTRRFGEILSYLHRDLDKEKLLQFRTKEQNLTFLALAVKFFDNDTSFFRGILKEYQQLINVPNKTKQTPLMWFIDDYDKKEYARDYNKRCLTRVKLLIEHGADLNLTDCDGNTVLDYVNRNDFKEIAELLLQHGAKSGKELMPKKEEELTIDYPAPTAKLSF